MNALTDTLTVPKIDKKKTESVVGKSTKLNHILNENREKKIFINKNT